MAELLLELLSEEIPARMQDRAAADLKRLVCDRLKAAGLSYDSAEAYATPRRLALVVDGLPARQPDVRVERKGPRVGAPEKAIEGFLKSAGLQSVDQCQVQEIKGAQFYIAVRERMGLKASKILPSVINEAIHNLPWPKSMGWGELHTPTKVLLSTLVDDIIYPLDVLLSKDREELDPKDLPDKDRLFRWVRPLHGIIAIFDGKILPGVIFAGGLKILKFSAQTAGHRFMAPDEFTVTGFADYRDKLRSAYVMLDSAERRSVIEQDADLAAEGEGLTLKPDAGLVAEVAGLVEWPVVLTGAIDAEYMDLPAEVLTTAMRHHLKHFALLDSAGNLAPRFVVVANIHAVDGGKQIIAGNERVLRARLADAKFFWDQDRKRTLESRIPDLDALVFHAKLGSVGEKVQRIEALAVEIAKSIPGAEEAEVREAARLCKTDLVTGMVGEFPELQGVMGRYYALAEGKNEAVAQAIAEHYAPQGPNDTCPTAPVSIAVALADKIDILVGFWAIDEKPTGSKDPFALRRAALGVIRLITENKLKLSLHLLFEKNTANDLLGFFADRLKVHLKGQGVRHDLIAAVFAARRRDGRKEDDLVRLLARVQALQLFLAGEDGEHLLIGYRRASNIVRIEEKKHNEKYDKIDRDLFEQDEENDLWQNLNAVQDSFEISLDAGLFSESMAGLAQLRAPIDRFFDEVTVNVQNDKKRRANRLALLRSIMVVMNQVADFSQIEG